MQVLDEYRDNVTTATSAVKLAGETAEIKEFLLTYLVIMISGHTTSTTWDLCPTIPTFLFLLLSVLGRRYDRHSFSIAATCCALDIGIIVVVIPNHSYILTNVAISGCRFCRSARICSRSDGV